MILKQNEEGKYTLLDQEGNKVVFDYGVDASEALVLKDKDGNHRYTLPETKSVKPQKKPNPGPVDETDEEVEEPETEVVKREVKTLGNKAKAKAKAAKAKAAKAKKEKEAEEK